MVSAFPSIRLLRRVLDTVAEAAVKGYATDEEACGYLVGPAGDPYLCDEAVPLANLANRYHKLDPETYPRTGRTYFLIDPMKFAKGVDVSRAAGRPVKVIFHSHLDCGAYFSETDAAAATMGGSEPTYDVFYLVTSVRSGVVDDHKMFAWDPGTSGFVETPIAIVD